MGKPVLQVVDAPEVKAFVRLATILQAEEIDLGEKDEPSPFALVRN